MSNVTNAILTHVVWDEEASKELSIALERAGITSGRFTQVDQNAEGPKSMEVAVYVAAFNHLDERALLEAIRSVRWEEPANVQLLLRRQEEDRFTEVDVFGLHEPIRQRKLAADKGLILQGPLDQCRLHADLPALIRDFQEKATQIAGNPLRSVPWRERIVETTTQSPWLFEVLKIGPEQFFKSSTLEHHGDDVTKRGMVYTSHRLCRADLAYRGDAAALVLDDADVGDVVYDRAKDVLSSLDMGDILAFTGRVSVTQDGVWRLAPQSLKKINHL